MAEPDSKGERARGAPPDWDRRYGAAEGGLFGEEPNEFLRMMWARSDFRPRRVLMLGDGDGRNGTWLGVQGCEVTALDISTVANERARARDRAAGIEARRITADLALWSPREGEVWDAVIALYLQCERAVRAHAFKGAIARLVPGGWFVVEAFAATKGEPEGIGVRDQALRYDMGELEEAAGGLEFIEAFTGRTVLGEGPSHRGLAEVIRLAARRPGAAGATTGRA